MTAHYGYVKCKVVSDPYLKGKYLEKQRETQYHLHTTLRVETPGGAQDWDAAINVGTSDSDDLLNYKFAFDYHHPLRATLAAAGPGLHDLTGTQALPALDFLRTDVLAETGGWRRSDPMDGSEDCEPYATLKRLLAQAKAAGADVYVFGHLYTPPDNGVHDVHMNQGSTGHYIHRPGGHANEQNEVWQDGAVLVDLGKPEWSAYFTAFTNQKVPTDDLGNPVAGSHGIAEGDDGGVASA
jgi:uncharacterized protein YukJ